MTFHTNPTGEPKMAATQKPTPQQIFRARINHKNFSNPEWVRKFGWTEEDVDRVLRESNEILQAAKKFGLID